MHEEFLNKLKLNVNNGLFISVTCYCSMHLKDKHSSLPCIQEIMVPFVPIIMQFNTTVIVN